MELVARRLTVSEVLAEWGQIVRRQGGLILAWYLPFALVLSAVQIGIGARNGFAIDDQSANVVGNLIALTFGGIVGIFVYYLTLEQVMIREDLLEPGRPRRFGALFLATILSSLGAGLGLIFLIVPGLILMARWLIMGPAILAGDDLSGGLEDSWNATAQSQGTLTTTVVIMIVGQIAAVFGFGILTGLLPELATWQGLSPNFLIQTLGENVLSSLGSGLWLAFAAAVYRLLSGSKVQLEGVFA